MGYFKQMAEYADYCDRLVFRVTLAKVEASKFIGKDGKEYFRIDPPQRFAKQEPDAPLC